MSRAGARVLHDRQAPADNGHIDHIVINDQGIHVIETLPASVKTRLWVDADDVPRAGRLPLWSRLNRLSELASDLAGAPYAILDRAGDPLVYKVVAAVDRPGKASTTTTPT